MKAHNYYTEIAEDGVCLVRDEYNKILMTGTEVEAAMYIRMRNANQEAIYWKDMFLRLSQYINAE
jgi:hypothetical protein